VAVLEGDDSGLFDDDTLAEAQPDAFTPNLANSLAVYSLVLRMQDRQTEAERTLHEAITLLSPLFLNSFTAFSSLIGTLRLD
jgi:hypothetical protein